LRVVMVIGIYMQKSQQGLGGVPCILMDHRDRTKAQQEHDHALGQLERRYGAKGGAAAMPLGCFGVSYDRCGYMLHEGVADYLPGCSSNCSAGENTRPRISMVLISEVSPEDAKIMARITN